MSTNPPQGPADASADDQNGVREALRGVPDPGPMPADVSDRITAALASEQRRRTDPAEHDDVRRLLAAQPDPGPMPDLVARRISLALQREPRPAIVDDQTRVERLLRDTPDPGPMPVDVSDRITVALRAAAADRSAPADNVRPIGEGRTPSQGRRTRLIGGVVAAAAAGVVAVGVVPQLINSQNAAPVAGPASSSGSAGDVPPGLVDKVHVTNTNTAYTAASLPQQAGVLVKNGPGQTITPQQAAQLGSVATKEGALRCARAIGQDLKNDPNSINVDIATYESKPALVVVVTKDGRSTAWVLSRDCDKNPAPIAGPTTVT